MLKTIAAVLVAFGVVIQAAAADDLGPAIGTMAPDIGAPLDQSGMPRTFASLPGAKGVVLLFFRSAAW
jgi:hypothetical protein